jgi:hypothetical protein
LRTLESQMNPDRGEADRRKIKELESRLMEAEGEVEGLRSAEGKWKMDNGRLKAMVEQLEGERGRFGETADGCWC